MREHRWFSLSGNLKGLTIMPKGSVLLVDDDPTVIKLVRVLLEDAQYRVHVATGDDAMSTAQAVQPDVILLDVRMPGIGGVGISHLLRDDPNTGNIPIVALTADLARGIRDGMVADEWLGKPFDIDRLYDVIARWVRKRASASQGRSTGEG
jgi:CheY-like chemotaxis protein